MQIAPKTDWPVTPPRERMSWTIPAAITGGTSATISAVIRNDPPLASGSTEVASVTTSRAIAATKARSEPSKATAMTSGRALDVRRVLTRVTAWSATDTSIAQVVVGAAERKTKVVPISTSTAP